MNLIQFLLMSENRQTELFLAALFVVIYAFPKLVKFEFIPKPQTAVIGQCINKETSEPLAEVDVLVFNAGGVEIGRGKSGGDGNFRAEISEAGEVTVSNVIYGGVQINIDSVTITATAGQDNYIGILGVQKILRV